MTADLQDLPATWLERLERQACQGSFWYFCRTFWEDVPGAGVMVPNWHMELLCDEFQRVAERVFAGLPREHDTVFNISPGTSKSSLLSILSTPWIWTRMPSARVLSASHTDALALDLSNKSRWVVKSERYRTLFPEVRLRSEQDTKGYFANTAGGDRYTCTVAGKSPMGMHAHFILVDDPIDPKKVLSELELKAAADFMTNIIPTRKVNKAVSVIFLIMQRLGLGDPTDVMLEAARREGAIKARHICLPAELTDKVRPSELAARYVDGLLDPHRLGKQVLREYKAGRAHFYATQFLQEPYAAEGGMFRPEYFNQRVKAAPHDAVRIRYIDRAATQDGGCYTAMVLMARDKAGNYYVEDLVHGQWEPHERNQRMRATALKDRTRYGPQHEPKIWVEAEGGSSGRDAWKGVAAALAGFPVFEDKVTGDKKTRAEPWSAQCAARNVYLVDNGQSKGDGKVAWDIERFVAEHCSFPGSRLKDIVDSSSGAFNKLAGAPPAGTLHTFSFAKADTNKVRVFATTDARLANTVLDDRCLLVCVQDPPLDAGEETAWPLHGLSQVVDRHAVRCCDLDPAEIQDRWHEPVAPWGLPPERLILDRDGAKKLWAFLTRKREQPWRLVVVSGPDDRRARSVAEGIFQVFGKHQAAFADLGEPPDGDAKPVLNKHLVELVKLGRSLVL